MIGGRQKDIRPTSLIAFGTLLWPQGRGRLAVPCPRENWCSVDLTAVILPTRTRP